MLKHQDQTCAESYTAALVEELVPCSKDSKSLSNESSPKAAGHVAAVVDHWTYSRREPLPSPIQPLPLS